MNSKKYILLKPYMVVSTYDDKIKDNDKKSYND